MPFAWTTHQRMQKESCGVSLSSKTKTNKALHPPPSCLAPQAQVLCEKNQLPLFPPSPLCSPALALPLPACRPANVGTMPPPGALASPPPRNGFAIRPKGVPPPPPPPMVFEEEEGWNDCRPRVEPCLAASKRSLTARSCDSNLSASLALRLALPV
jgi:hypothetical protein